MTVSAIDKLGEVETAIRSGDLERANDLLGELRPLLVERRMESLLACKAKIETLTSAAETLRENARSGLLDLGSKRRSAAAYEAHKPR